MRIRFLILAACIAALLLVLVLYLSWSSRDASVLIRAGGSPTLVEVDKYVKIEPGGTVDVPLPPLPPRRAGSAVDVPLPPRRAPVTLGEAVAPPPPSPTPTIAEAARKPTTVDLEPASAADERSKMLNQALTLKALPVGKIVLRAPKEMKVGDVRQVDANIGLDVPSDVLEKELRPEDQKLEGSAHLSRKMEASLVGVGFKIIPLKPEQQTIAIGFPSVWSWSVEAKSPSQDFFMDYRVFAA
jgi:hypothetical protein